MPNDRAQSGQGDAAPAAEVESRTLPAAAKRALAEAAERRRKASPAGGAVKEIAGRGGLEPTRYGDWEVAGLISDF